MYGKVLKELDKNELLNYESLKNEYISRLNDEMYVLKILVENQNKVIEGYGALIASRERTSFSAQRLREYEESKEEKYRAIFNGEAATTSEVCLTPAND